MLASWAHVIVADPVQNRVFRTKLGRCAQGFELQKRTRAILTMPRNTSEIDVLSRS